MVADLLTLTDVRVATRHPPHLQPGVFPEWKPPRIQVFLVGGFHRAGRRAEWTLVGRLGGPVVLLTHAQLFPFRAGKGAASAAAKEP